MYWDLGMKTFAAFMDKTPASKKNKERKYVASALHLWGCACIVHDC